MAPDLSFGSGGNRWYYTRDTKTYDLTRGNGQDPEHGFTLATTQGPTGTSITIDPAQSALVVVDMQNYFLDARCRDYPAGLATVEPLLKVIGKCREVGVQVRYLPRASLFLYSIRRTTHHWNREQRVKGVEVKVSLTLMTIVYNR